MTKVQLRMMGIRIRITTIIWSEVKQQNVWRQYDGAVSHTPHLPVCTAWVTGGIRIHCTVAELLLSGNTEMWWEMHVWNGPIHWYNLFVKEAGKARRRGCTLCKECICLEKGYKPAVNLSLRLRMRTQENIGNVVGVCYQPFDQEKAIVEVLCRQVEEASWLQALVCMWDFKQPGICW